MFKKIKSLLRPLREIAYLVTGYAYDFYRYVRFANIFSRQDPEKRDYLAMKIYHRMEKSLSFRDRSPSAGWSGAVEYVQYLKKYAPKPAKYTFQERNGLKVLADFANQSAHNGRYAYIDNFVAEELALGHLGDEGGAVKLTSAELYEGILESPDRFFLSRYSVRDFSKRAVDANIVEKAISLALNSPSVCNRQGWHVYFVSSRPSIDEVLKHQNGNKGFGHEVPFLLIICADLKAFDVGIERNQHWIDGGIFVGSLVWSLHALGLGTCCLNWSKGAGEDRAFRKTINVADHHSILTLMAIGHPNESFSACHSARSPIEKYLSKIEL